MVSEDRIAHAVVDVDADEPVPDVGDHANPAACAVHQAAATTNTGQSDGPGTSNTNSSGMVSDAPRRVLHRGHNGRRFQSTPGPPHAAGMT